MHSSEAYGPLAFAYDESTGTAALARVTSLVKRVLTRHPAAPLTHLDLACGTGRVVRLFERLGYTSVGVDGSLPMLLLSSGRAPRRVAGDLRDLPLAATFGAITLLSDSLNSLRRRSDLVRCFRAIRRCLGPESLLMFDVSTPRTISHWSDDGGLRTRGRNHALSIRATYSRPRRLATLQFEGWAKHRAVHQTISETHYLKAHSRREITQSLGQASLRAIEVIGFRRYPENEAWLFVVRAV